MSKEKMLHVKGKVIRISPCLSFNFLVMGKVRSETSLCGFHMTWDGWQFCDASSSLDLRIHINTRLSVDQGLSDEAA
jgi:hypothetical protein